MKISHWNGLKLKFKNISIKYSMVTHFWSQGLVKGKEDHIRSGTSTVDKRTADERTADPCLWRPLHKPVGVVGLKSILRKKTTEIQIPRVIFWYGALFNHWVSLSEVNNLLVSLAALRQTSKDGAAVPLQSIIQTTVLSIQWEKYLA